jgi:putative DNA primase/helicase
MTGIPQELRGTPHWVAWRLEPPNTAGSKFRKVPVNAKSGKNASSTDPKTWDTFEAALKRMRRDGLAGVGFVFTDSGLVGIDIDKCRDAKAGAITAEAREIIEAVSTYTELSPSGTGVHLIARGKLPGKGRRKGKIEIYDTGRFFTVTGVPVPDTQPAIRERQAALDELYARLRAEQEGPNARGPTPSPQFVDLDDDEVVRRASAARNGAKFSALWGGSTEVYPSASEADLALCCLLAFRTRCKPDAIDRLFRKSGLYRTKWDERHGELTYGQMTIEKALSSTRTVRSERRGVVSGSERAGVGIPLTDTGNAERLVERFGADVRFCHAWKKWLVWDGKRWRVDESGAVMGISKRVARSIHSEAEACDEPHLREETSKWAIKSEKVDRRKAMVELAKSEGRVPILHEQLDKHPMLLNCPNGTIDLATGEFRAHRREDYMTKLCSTPFLPDAECPKFREFLNRVLPDSEVQEYLQRFFGYSLTGDISEQQLLLAVGDGANGKSTLFNLVQGVLGNGYAIQISGELLLAHDYAAHPTELADLFGVRLAIGTETPKDRVLNESLVKQLTGGEPIRARRMREDSWQFDPTHKLVLVTNHMPKVSADAFAIQRRLHVVEFEVRIQPRELDKHLPQKLRGEREGILAWAACGCLAWRERGLDPPSSVVFQPKSNVASVRQPAEEFVALYVVRKPGARTGATAVFGAFLEWCALTGAAHCSQKEFGTFLGREGFGKRKSGGRDVYLDMVLTWPGSPAQGPSGTNGDLRPVDSLGAPHEASNREKVPDDPRWSPEIGLEQCRACGGTRRWRRAGSSTEWFCMRCVSPTTTEIEVRDA